MQNGALMAVGGLALVLGLTFVVVVGAAIWMVFRERLGVATDLELQGRLDRLESNLKNITIEWETQRSSIDTIVRRGIRLKVLEGRKEPDNIQPADVSALGRPLSRADLLKRALRPVPKKGGEE